MTTEDQQPVLTDEMVQALQRSGYLMEARVNRVIRDREWFTNPNNYIPDPITGTPRESDLIAERPFPIVEGEFHVFSSVAAIECVNNDQPLVFLSRVPDDQSRTHLFLRFGGFPKTIEVPQGRDDVDDGIPIASVLGSDLSHRFFQVPAYDMYCTFSQRNKAKHDDPESWRAEQPKDFYESFKKVIHVREYFEDLHNTNLLRAAAFGDGKPSARIVHYHQVMVFKGPLVTFDELDGTLEGDYQGKAVQHILYRRSQGNQDGLSSTLVDVITEDYLPDFLALLEQEARHFCGVLSDRIEQLTARISPDVRAAAPFYLPKLASSDENES